MEIQEKRLDGWTQLQWQNYLNYYGEKLKNAEERYQKLTKKNRTKKAQEKLEAICKPYPLITSQKINEWFGDSFIEDCVENEWVSEMAMLVTEAAIIKTSRQVDSEIEELTGKELIEAIKNLLKKRKKIYNNDGFYGGARNKYFEKGFE